MRRPRFLLLIILIMLFLVAALAGAAPGSVEDPAATVILGQVRARLDAYARGSAKEWARFVADDCICGLETKPAIESSIGTRPPGVKHSFGEILEPKIRLLGDAAVLRYRITEYTEVNGQRTSIEQWRTETFVRRSGAWILIAGAETIIPPEPSVAKIDPRVFDSYVGKYQYTPGAVDTITREGDRLFVQSTGEPRMEIFPENETTFFAKGQPWRLVFRKDPSGAVTSLIFRQNGQEFTAKRSGSE